MDFFCLLLDFQNQIIGNKIIFVSKINEIVNLLQRYDIPQMLQFLLIFSLLIIVACFICDLIMSNLTVSTSCVVPQNYTCFKCKSIGDHWIMKCKLNSFECIQLKIRRYSSTTKTPRNNFLTLYKHPSL